MNSTAPTGEEPDSPDAGERTVGGARSAEHTASGTTTGKIIPNYVDLAELSEPSDENDDESHHGNGCQSNIPATIPATPPSAIRTTSPGVGASKRTAAALNPDMRPGDDETTENREANEDGATQIIIVPPRQRADSATARIVGRIGADRPSRILAADSPSAPPPDGGSGGRPEALGTSAGGRARPTAAAATNAASGRGRHPALADAAACIGFVAFALFLTNGLWPDPAGRSLALNPDDQILSEWFLSYGARVYSGDFSLVTDRLNAPEGVNLLSNASTILLAVLLGPITLAFGAPASFAVAMALNLAGTATGWYLLLARELGRHRVAAAIGAAFAGFAPGIVAQSNGHPHISAQWLIPPMVWCLLRIANPPGGNRRFLLTSALLGFLITLQYHLGAEVLYLTGLGLLLFGAAYAAVARARIRSLLPTIAQGLGAGGGVAAVLLAYPLWVHLGGPQHVRGGPYPTYHFSLDMSGLTAISPLSLAGNRSAAEYATDPAEYNAFFGLPLLLVLIGTTLWLWRRPVVIATAAAAAALLLLAMGPVIVVGGQRTGIPGPYALVDNLPILDAALPGRIALAAVPLFAVLLTLAVDAALTVSPRTDPALATNAWPAMRWVRLAVPVAVLGALAPIAPEPFPTTHRDPVPRYITEGYWRGCGAGGGVVVPVPLPEPRNPESMRWAAAAGAGFAMPEGFFIGPYGENGQASLGTFPRPTSQLLARVAETGQAPQITALERDSAAVDADFWGARCFVLAEQPHRDALQATMEQLFGAGTKIADVTIWRVTR